MFTTPEESERITAFNRWDRMVWILGDSDLSADDQEFQAQSRKHSIRDLVNGVRFEYKTMNSVFRTEALLISACKQLNSTIDALMTFDGTERVVEVDDETAALVVAG